MRGGDEEDQKLLCGDISALNPPLLRLCCALIPSVINQDDCAAEKNGSRALRNSASLPVWISLRQQCISPIDLQPEHPIESEGSIGFEILAFVRSRSELISHPYYWEVPLLIINSPMLCHLSQWEDFELNGLTCHSVNVRHIHKHQHSIIYLTWMLDVTHVSILSEQA